MKPIVLFYVLFGLSAAWAGDCPDLSGKYKTIDDNGRDSLSEIKQNGCKSIFHSNLTSKDNWALQLDGVPRFVGDDGLPKSTSEKHQDNWVSAKFDGKTLIFSVYSASSSGHPASIPKAKVKLFKRADGNLNFTLLDLDTSGKVTTTKTSIAIRTH